METQVQVINSADVMAAINASEIDSQVATAHRFPRDVEKALAKIEMLASVDEETAADLFGNQGGIAFRLLNREEIA